MAINIVTGEDIEVTECQMRLLALKEIHQWVTLNLSDLEEDFYNSRTMDDLYQIDDQSLLEFGVLEKHDARKEFQEINRWLSKRRKKYQRAIDKSKL